VKNFNSVGGKPRGRLTQERNGGKGNEGSEGIGWIVDYNIYLCNFCSGNSVENIVAVGE